MEKKQKITIDEYRILPSGSKFWSVKNQTSITCCEDEIVKIKHTCCGSDAVFAEPCQLMYNLAGFFPAVISRGTDEWEFSYSKTLPYDMPDTNMAYPHNIVHNKNTSLTLMSAATELYGILRAIYNLLHEYHGIEGNTSYVNYCHKKALNGIENSNVLDEMRSAMFDVDMSKRKEPNMQQLLGIVKNMFTALDDIDSAGDMFKPKWCARTSAVEIMHKMRWTYCKVCPVISDTNSNCNIDDTRVILYY